jgi:hypothetical protein
MDEEKVQRIRSILPVGMGAGVGALLALLFGKSLVLSPFESTRPPERPLTISQANPNMIDARLWEDPLRAVSDRAGGTAGLRLGAGVPEELKTLLVQPDAGNGLGGDRRGGVVVLAVALDGSSTSEATESRLRTRVAVISALAQRGLIPEGDGGLYLASIARAKDKDGANRPLPLAYEIFRFDPLGEGARHEFEDTPAKLRGAVVVWLDEAAIAGDEHSSGTIANLAFQLAELLEKAGLKADGLESLRFLALAPVTSRLLGNVADDLAGRLADASAAEAPRVDRLIQAANEYLDEQLAPDERSQLERRAVDHELTDPDPQLMAAAVALAQRERDKAPDDVLSVGVALLAALRNREGYRQPRGPAVEIEPPPSLASGEDLKEPKDLSTAAGTDSRVLDAYVLAVRDLRALDHPDSDDDWPLEVAGRWLTGSDDVDQLGAHAQSRQEGAAASIRTLQEEIRGRLDVYSPRATTPLALARLFDQRGRARSQPRTVAAGLAGGNRSLSVEPTPALVTEPEGLWKNGLTMLPDRMVSAVLSDQELAASLIDELGRRGLDLVGSAHRDEVPRDHLVLVSEWDTLYGRSLPFMFEVELSKRALGPGIRYEDLYDQRLTNRIQEPPNVHRFSYLRGLDGETSETPGGDGSAKRSAGAGKPGSPAEEREARLRQLEGSEGSRQLDMIRRVGDRIAALDRNLQATRSGRVRAIGVLGSDFHDKLMVLQALRGQFSDAIFFTTDLDARLLQPRWYSLARNLVVASSYGLELAPHLQCHTPPFRDSYSTATFAAVLAGLQQIDPRLVHAGDEERSGACTPVTLGHLQQLRPLIFEIGRSGAIELAPVGDRMGVHPGPTDPRPVARRVALVGFPLLLGIFGWLAGPLVALMRSRLGPEGETAGSFKLRWLVAVIAGVLLFASWRVMLNDARSGGEPLYWLQGVSAWPSELLWVVGALLGVFLLARAVVALADDASLLAPYFVDGDSSPVEMAADAVDGKRHRLGWLVAGWRNLGLRRWGCASSDPVEVWTSYREAGRLRWRLTRVAVSVAAVAAMMGALAYLFGMTSLPIRSEAARTFHWLSSSLATLSLMVLALFVFDATRLCVCFIDTLTQRGCATFPRTVRSTCLAQRLGMSLDEAGELLTLRVVAERTETVGRLLLYPFFLTAIFVVARSGMFDSWSWPGAVTGLVILVLLILLGSGLHLQRSARRARQRALARLEERRLRLLGSHQPQGQEWATQAQVAAMREEVRALDRGAFANWSANPVLGALLLPFGGAGAAWLIDLILQFGS